MRKTITLFALLIFLTCHSARATDFSLVTTLGGAFDLDFNPISTEQAMNSLDPVIWQVDFGVLTDNLSSGHAGFGVVAFNINLADATDAFDMGWQPYNPNVASSSGVPGAVNPLFMTNMDAGHSAIDKQGILVNVAPGLSNHADPRRSVGQELGAPSLIGSLFVQDVPESLSQISVNRIEFSGINLDGSFFRASDAYGQSTMTLPRSPEGLAGINVSTANAPPAPPVPVTPPVVPTLPPVVETPQTPETSPELPDVFPEPIEVPEPVTLPPIVEVPSVVEPNIPEEGGNPTPDLPENVFPSPGELILFPFPSIDFRPILEYGWIEDGSGLLRFQPFWNSIQNIDVVLTDTEYFAAPVSWQSMNNVAFDGAVLYTSAFGQRLGTLEPTRISVPEPGTVFLVFLAAVGASLQRRR